MVAVGAGESFSEGQATALARLITEADAATGLRFSVVVGPLPGGRDDALQQHQRLPRSAESVLLAVDPRVRAVEIVVGRTASTRVDDQVCALATATMVSSFAAGDLAGGLRSGLTLLRDRGVPEQVRHLDRRS